MRDRTLGFPRARRQLAIGKVLLRRRYYTGVRIMQFNQVTGEREEEGKRGESMQVKEMVCKSHCMPIAFDAAIGCEYGTCDKF